ncbi:MAG: aldehyde dehydrogenase family protein, partial [Proteobacteria bacterium]|nr:aldehyde dehydrogenase family protein [Pseudomonadota bacterium]
MDFLKNLGIKEINSGITTGTESITGGGPITSSYSPADGREIARIQNVTWDDYELVMAKAQSAFTTWKMVPAPQ